MMNIRSYEYEKNPHIRNDITFVCIIYNSVFALFIFGIG